MHSFSCACVHLENWKFSLLARSFTCEKSVKLCQVTEHSRNGSCGWCMHTVEHAYNHRSMFTSVEHVCRGAHTVTLCVICVSTLAENKSKVCFEDSSTVLLRIWVPWATIENKQIYIDATRITASCHVWLRNFYFEVFNHHLLHSEYSTITPSALPTRLRLFLPFRAFFWIFWTSEIVAGSILLVTLLSSFWIEQFCHGCARPENNCF